MDKIGELELNNIYCMDCLDGLKKLPDNSFDLVLTDPPYGISADKGVGGFGSSPDKAKKYEDNWDDSRPSPEIFKEILRVGKKVIIFGGNYMTDMLPVGKSWIVWDKIGNMKFDNPFSDCELAWTNLDKKTVKKYIIIQQGFVAEEKQRFHPTQKPMKLFRNIIRDLKDINTVLDPFMGSGTTALACKQLQIKWLGFELEQKYVDIANKRLEQGNLKDFFS